MCKARKLAGKTEVSQGKARELKVLFHYLPKMEDDLKFLTSDHTVQILYMFTYDSESAYSKNCFFFCFLIGF